MSAPRNRLRTSASWAHIESTCPLAEVKRSGGWSELRRAAARLVISCADWARFITAIGRPPIISIGTSNLPEFAGTEESAAFHTIGLAHLGQDQQQITSRIWCGHRDRLLSLRRAASSRVR